MIMEFANGDSFLNVMAAQSVIGGYDYWTIRMTAIDENMDVLWSKDVYLTNGSGTRQSTTPFAICRSADGNGFVIAGIWDPSTQPMIGHLGIQHPFYMEVSTAGTIVQTYKGETGQIDQGYAPLSITPTSDGGYISVGVASSTCYTVSQNQMGYISKMNSSFVETNGKLVVSSFNISSTGVNPIVYRCGKLWPQVPYNGQSQRFDALNKVVSIGLNETESYIITGSMTGNLLSNSDEFYFGTAGISDGYIARIDTSLSLIWETKVHDIADSTNGQDAGGNVNFNLVDIKLDQITNELFVVGNQINGAGGGGGPLNGLILRLDLDSGTVNYSQRIDGHDNYKDNLISQIILDNGNYYLCGFGNDGIGLLSTNGPMTSLHPLVLKFDQLSNNCLGGWIIDGDNVDYNYYGSHVGYLGINYNGIIQSNATQTCCPQQYVYNPMNYNEAGDTCNHPANLLSTIDLMQSFPIYFPTSWWHSTADGFSCTVNENAWNNQAISIMPNFGTTQLYFQPAIYKNTENRQCDMELELPDNAGSLLESNVILCDTSIFFDKLSIVGIDHEVIISSNLILATYKCVDDIMPQQPMAYKEINAFRINQDQENKLVFLPKELLESKKYKYSLVDLSGKDLELSKTSDGISMVGFQAGIYLFLVFEDTSLIQVNKIYVY